jgi:pyridoxamine 5'-phosphate oxidase
MTELNINIKNLRQDYRSSSLLEETVSKNPIEQFAIWFDEAVKAEILEPNAMTLATASKNALPSARIVLLKGFDEEGFTFFTNFNSHKGLELTENPFAALVFFWGDLERQIRIEGVVERISDEESKNYFHSRPKGSQLGAWASPQSKIIPHREFLDEKIQEMKHKYASDEVIPKPEHWGGYKVIPNQIEFWQGRSNRLHDRILYTQQKDESWTIERLAP